MHENAIFLASSCSQLWQGSSQLNVKDPFPNVQPLKKIRTSDCKELQSSTSNAVVALAVETAMAGFGALVFCSGRQNSQNMAELISSAMPLDNVSDEILLRRHDVISDLRSLSVGLDEVLEKTVLRGVAFHRWLSTASIQRCTNAYADAGLTCEERDIVAESYDKGVLRVIVATCSLAAGINLPARRVILQGVRMGKDLVGPALLYLSTRRIPFYR